MPVNYPIFMSHLCYASRVWAQNTNSVKSLHVLRKKVLRIMFFQTRNSHTGSLFKLPKIQKSFDKTALGNCFFVSKSLKALLPSIFNNWFKLSLEAQFLKIRWSNIGFLKISSYRTSGYSMFVNSIYVWNRLKNCHQNVIFYQLRANKLKQILTISFLNRYEVACITADSRPPFFLQFLDF